MERCRHDYSMFAHVLDVCSWDQFERHMNSCPVCQLRIKFAEAIIRRVNQETKGSCGPSVGKLVDGWSRFEIDCVVEDVPNRRFVVKQGYCFCGERASTIPLPLREATEQRANSECSACGARWRVAHCREGCGAPLDGRFDELCDKCKWIKCPAGHCSNADCDN